MGTFLTDLRQRLRPSPDPQAPLDPAEPVEHASSPGLEVEFAAYAVDCRVFGFLRLAGDRMSDALNDAPEYRLTDVMVVRLGDGLATQALELTVRRDELHAVRAAGPRGDPARRSRRRPSHMTLQTGPYVIHGYVHGVPGADPLQQVRRRKPMVPMTEAWLEYESNGQHHRARAGTLIVNRELWDWIRLSREEEVKLPDLPAETKPDPFAKDFTGYITDHR